MKYSAHIFTGCLFILLGTFSAVAQNAQSYFNTAANHYVQSRLPEATAKATEGLKKYPGDKKLQELLKRMQREQQQQKQKQDQQKKEQEKKDQEKKDQEQKDQQQKDQEEKDKKDQQKKDQDKQDQDKKDQEKKDQQEKDQDKEGKDQKEKEKKDQQQKDSQEQKDNDQKKDEKVPPEVAKRLQEMKIPEEKAQMLLDAMKNQEVQYLQQNKRRPTKPRDKGKPDW